MKPPAALIRARSEGTEHLQPRKRRRITRGHNDAATALEAATVRRTSDRQSDNEMHAPVLARQHLHVPVRHTQNGATVADVCPRDAIVPHEHGR
jgi:hypothetical protein